MIIAHSAATRIVSPVVYEAAPEHSKTAGAAISSGPALQPVGMAPIIPLTKRLYIMPFSRARSSTIKGNAREKINLPYGPLFPDHLKRLAAR